MASTAAWVRSEAPSFSRARWRYFFHRADAPAKSSADFPVRHPLGNQAQHFLLDRGQRLATLAAGFRPRLGRCVRQRGPEERRIQHRLAVPYRLERGQQLPAADTLQHVAGRPAFHRSPDQPRVIVHGDDEDGHASLDGLESAKHGEPVEIRQLDVEQDHVGGVPRGSSKGFFAGPGLTHHLDAGRFEHAPESLADHRMVVDDQDAGGIRTPERRGHSAVAVRRGRACRPRAQARRRRCRRGDALVLACWGARDRARRPIRRGPRRDHARRGGHGRPPARGRPRPGSSRRAFGRSTALPGEF